MTRRIIAISLVFAMLPVCALADVDWLRKYLDETDLAVTGSKTFRYKARHVSGNETMYFDDNYDRPNETNITVAGKLFGGLSLNATLIDNRWNPNQRVFTLGYEGRDTKLSIGDINASLNGNSLVPFTRRLKGLMLSQKVGSSTFTGIVSKTKAVARTISTTGNNTPGPYYLGASQIIDGSERIKIDEREIPRTDNEGFSNYTLDPLSGILQFKDGFIVPQGSVITVSFETQGYNNVAGTLWGIRGSIPITDALNCGLTYLTQSSGSDSAPKEIVERIRGGSSAEVPFVLLNVPLEGTVVVKIDGILQRPDEFVTTPEGVTRIPYDYYVNYRLNQLIFHRPIPATSIITVSYLPRPDRSVSGDRSVLGFDSAYKISENLSLEGQFARSTSDYTGTGPGGSALNLSANAKLNKMTMSVGLKNIDPTFASVDSAGFMRNEKGASMSFQYTPNERIRFHSAYDKTSRPYYQTFGSSADAPYVDFTNLSSGLVIELPRWPTISLNRTRLSNVGGNDTSSIARSQGTDSLDLRWNSPTGRLVLGAGISRNTDNDELNPQWSSTSNTSQFNVQYLPGEKFSIAADFASSKITDGTGSAYDAKNSQLTATYLPTSTLSFSANYRVNDSGRLSAYGDYSGVGDTYGGGYQNLGYVTSYGGKSVVKSFGVRYAPGQRFAIDASLNRSFTEGDNTTNTFSTGQDFGITLNPWNWLQFMGHISLQDMDYVGSVGGMGSKIGFFRMSLGPIKQFSLDLNYQRMLSNTVATDGTSTIVPYSMDYNLNTFSAELRRPFGGGKTAFLQYLSSDTAGFLDSSKTVTKFGVDFPLNKILGITFDWRITDYNDTKTPDNSYRASSLNVEFGARFR